MVILGHFSVFFVLFFGDIFAVRLGMDSRWLPGNKRRQMRTKNKKKV